MPENSDNKEQNNYIFPEMVAVNLCHFSYTPVINEYQVTSKRPKKTRLRSPFQIRDKGSIRFENNEAIKQFGQRMKSARELCNFTQAKAAALLGYSNSSKLSKIELGSDTSSVPLWVVIKASKLYDVSTDYLLFLSDDWERDPVVSQQRQISGWLVDRWENARAAELNAIRVLTNRLLAVEKAVAHGVSKSMEFKSIVDRFRELNADFDDMKLGAKLLRFAAETTEEAVGISYELKRFHVSMEIAEKGANVKLRAKDFDGLANNDVFELSDDGLQ